MVTLKAGRPDNLCKVTVSQFPPFLPLFTGYMRVGGEFDQR